ncbi:MAG: FHA domain-containing protein [Chloroflexi bacterium]|nr:FHA domain-containing protein [Chloroflexota bacterium]
MRIIEDAARVRGRLLVERGLAAGPFALVEREYVVGRDRASGVLLAHPTVSRRHARLTPREGGFVVADAGSTSGTLVNGAKIDRETALRPGDAIEIGEVRLRFEA